MIMGALRGLEVSHGMMNRGNIGRCLDDGFPDFLFEKESLDFIPCG